MSLSTIVLAGHPIESLGERMVSPPPCVRLDFRVSTGAGRVAELTAAPFQGPPKGDDWMPPRGGPTIFIGVD
jgi:hypothetical protein